MYKYDVFISFKNTDNGQVTKDCEMAESLYNELKSHNVSVFFSNISIMECGEGDYRKLIDDALDQSMILVAVGTKKEYLQSRWVEYEYASFHDDILSGSKSDECTVCSYISDMKQNELPRPLRNLQSFSNQKDVVRFVLNRLNRADGGNHEFTTDSGNYEKKSEKPKKSTKIKKKKRKKTSEKRNTGKGSKKKKFSRAVICVFLFFAVLVSAVLIRNAVNRLKIPVETDGAAEYITVSKNDSNLYISNCNINEASFQEILKMKKLNSLNISNCSFTDDSCSYIGEITSLKYLTVEGTSGISDCSFINNLNLLTSMELIDCGITSDAFELNESLNELESVDLSNNNDLDNISFVEYCENLESLNVENTAVSDLSLLCDLSALETVRFCNTAVTDISPLGECKELVNVNGNNNKIGSITPLACLENLESIDFSNCNIEEISERFVCIYAKEIILSDNPLTDISGLLDLSVLTTLDVGSCRLSSKQELLDLVSKNCATLKYCDLSENALNADDLACLKGSASLEICVLSGSSFEDFSFLSDSSALRELYAENCSVQSLNGLENISALRVLNASHNSISDVTPLQNSFSSVNGNINIDLSYNEITDITNLFNPDITYSSVILNGNEITDFSPLSAVIVNRLCVEYTNELLENIACIENITDLYVSNVPNDKKAVLEENLQHGVTF